MPPGSSLDRFFLLLYINDLLDCFHERQFAQFGDNVSLYNFGPKGKNKYYNDVRIARSCSQTMKGQLASINVNHWALELSELFPLQTQSAGIRLQTQCKNSGNYLNTKLTFEKHIVHVTKNENKFCGTETVCCKNVVSRFIISMKEQRRIFGDNLYRRKWNTFQNVTRNITFLILRNILTNIKEVVIEVFKQLGFEWTMLSEKPTIV